jgi:hypothetical protein
LEEELAQGRQKFRKEMNAKVDQVRRQFEDSSQKKFEELRKKKYRNSSDYNSNYGEQTDPS